MNLSLYNEPSFNLFKELWPESLCGSLSKSISYLLGCTEQPLAMYKLYPITKMISLLLHKNEAISHYKDDIVFIT